MRRRCCGGMCCSCCLRCNANRNCFSLYRCVALRKGVPSLQFSQCIQFESMPCAVESKQRIHISHARQRQFAECVKDLMADELVFTVAERSTIAIGRRPSRSDEKRILIRCPMERGEQLHDLP